MDSINFTYYDLLHSRKSTFNEMFTDWKMPENVVILAPHDDDGMIGVGYAIQACQNQGATVYIIIFHDGSAGFSHPKDAESIIMRRKQETLEAYKNLGIDAKNIYRLEVPDFSGLNYLGWKGPGRQQNEMYTFEKVLKILRAIKATRLFIPNGYREHHDHTATFLTGLYDGIQAGDPVLMNEEWGQPTKIKSFYIYSVWGDFSPLDESTSQTFAIGVNQTIEEKVQHALNQWVSQQDIIKGLIHQRQERFVETHHQFLEIYLQFDPRPKLNLEKYKKIVSSIR